MCDFWRKNTKVFFDKLTKTTKTNRGGLLSAHARTNREIVAGIRAWAEILVQFVNKLFQTYDIDIMLNFTSIKTTFIHGETI